MGGRWLMAALLTLSACKDDAFFCTDDEQCVEAGAPGICQPNDLCSFPDDDCASGQAYSQYSGTLAGRCVEDDDDDETDAPPGTAGDTGTGPTTNDPTDDTATATTVATTDPVDSGPSTTTGDDTTDTTEPGDESSGTSMGSDSDSGPPQNGSTCQSNEDCASGACYESFLGAVCGECTSDADCEFGCTPPHPLHGDEQWAVCNGGELGDSCEDSTACGADGLQCVSFANIAGILSISTCSECAEGGDDCPGSMLCNEFFNASEFRGGFSCVNPGSLFEGSFCTVGEVGEAACMGHCASGSYKGLFNFGVCSECASDGDCPGDQTCQPPEMDLDAGTSTSAQCQ